jgi:hypothetical protein
MLYDVLYGSSQVSLAHLPLALSAFEYCTRRDPVVNGMADQVADMVFPIPTLCVPLYGNHSCIVVRD